MLGGNKKVQQAPQGISLIMTVNDLEELAEKSGGGGLEGRVQHRQQVLDRALKRIKVLKTQESRGFKKATGSLLISYKVARPIHSDII